VALLNLRDSLVIVPRVPISVKVEIPNVPLSLLEFEILSYSLDLWKSVEL